MIDKPIFTGAATALITPTTPAGVDYDALGRLIDWQIEKGIDGRHRVRIERSPYNHRLEDKAAGLLVVDAYLNDGGIRP